MPARVAVDYVPPKDRRSKPHLEVTFPFNPEWVALIKSVPDAKFMPAGKTKCGGTAFWVPADMATAKMLRKHFGDALKLSPAVRRWGAARARQARTLSSLSLADTAVLSRLPKRLSMLYNALYVGPRGAAMTNKEFKSALKESQGSFQLADVAFMARALSSSGVNCVNANQPGMGKTMETIGAVFEAERDEGPNLVIAPVTSLDVVWKFELERWQDHPVLVASENKTTRTEAVTQAKAWAKAGEPFWLVCSPGMVQFRTRQKKDAKGKVILDEDGQPEREEYILYPEVFDIEWNTITLDEFHKMGLGNPATATSRAVQKLTAAGKDGLSGTPLGGNPIKLYGILHWLDPEEFSSKWRFANQWLDVEEKEHRRRGGGVATSKTIGGIRESVREEFDIMLSQYLTRRTKEECLPWLPPKQFIDRWCEMDRKQDKQYQQFALEAEIRIDEQDISAATILAEYTRLKQFADAEQMVLGVDPKTLRPILKPTINSGKLRVILELLEERGIRKEDPEGDEQVVIFSQFSSMVDMICTYLNNHGIPVEKITGAVSARKRGDLVRRFQAGKVRVMVITTTAGGVSITLDKANTVIVCDETWNPDDTEQAVDRVHRGAKTKQVVVYMLRTLGTVEEYIQEVNLDKVAVNFQILDLRRKGLRATGVARPSAKR